MPIPGTRAPTSTEAQRDGRNGAPEAVVALRLEVLDATYTWDLHPRLSHVVALRLNAAQELYNRRSRNLALRVRQNERTHVA